MKNMSGLTPPPLDRGSLHRALWANRRDNTVQEYIHTLCVK